MKKKFIVTIVGTMLLSGCGVNNQSTSPAMVDEKRSKESVSTSVESTPNTLLSETSDKKIAVYGVQEKGDLFSSLDVAINGEPKTFDWSNVTNPSFYPQIFVIDLNKDGEDEIVIILTKGTGTGIHNSEVHVLRTDFTEIPVTDRKISFKTILKLTKKLIKIFGSTLFRLMDTSIHLNLVKATPANGLNNQRFKIYYDTELRIMSLFQSCLFRFLQETI